MSVCSRKCEPPRSTTVLLARVAARSTAACTETMGEALVPVPASVPVGETKSASAASSAASVTGAGASVSAAMVPWHWGSFRFSA